MNLSKSTYCNAIQCNKILWLDKYCKEEKSDIDNKSILDNGTEVGILTKGLFGTYIDIQFNKDLNNLINIQILLQI